MSRLFQFYLAAALFITSISADDSSNYIYWCNDRAKQLCPATGQILSDLSCGWCRSWTMSANVMGKTLRVVGLDGGALPGDGDNKHTYLVSADLNSAFAVADPKAWRLSPIPSLVWNTQHGALWSDHDAETLFRYGGHSLGAAIPDSNELPRYDIASNSWSTTDSASQTPRFTNGAPVNIPQLGLAFYIGGQANNRTTLDSSVADGNLHYQTQMIKFNTSSARGSEVDAPFLPVQYGAANYVPAGMGQSNPKSQGVLVYLGGESPSQDVVPVGNNATVANSWDHVWIYDIGGDRWYKQPTTGLAQARTEFCSSTFYDNTTESWQLWVMGGADFETKSIIAGVSVLSIPSFQWFEAADVPASTPPRMSLECQQYGSQIFGLGGRTDDSDWGGEDFDAIGYVYDTNQQTTLATFDPSATAYTAPQTIRDAISATKYPATWGDAAVSGIFVAKETRSSQSQALSTAVSGSSSSSSSSSGGGGVPHNGSGKSQTTSTSSIAGTGSPSLAESSPSPVGSSGGSNGSSATIAAVVVSALFGLSLVIFVVYVLLKRRRARREQAEKAASDKLARRYGVGESGMAELSANVGELSAGIQRWELQGSKVV